MSHILVLPNLSSFRSRGKLTQRWAVAQELGCGVMELPADLVKSAREEERTGQPIGDVLTKGNVEKLYGASFLEGRSILHTDPGIPRRDRGGGMVIPKLRWGDPKWSGRYAQSVGWIVSSIGGGVEAVEVHPGNENGNADDLAAGFRHFSDTLASSLGREVPLLVENKHGHRVDFVENMVTLMDLLPRSGRFGLVVDISNLWKTYRRRTSEAMEELPWERVRALHLHLKHRAPGANDPIDWRLIFTLIKEKARGLYINPEVFHRGELEKALAIIQKGLSND